MRCEDIPCVFCYDILEMKKYKEHLEEWHRISVKEELEIAMERSRQTKTYMEGSDELSWEDVLKYNDLSNGTIINVLDKNNVDNIRSQNTSDHKYREQEYMSEDVSSTSTLSDVKFTKMTNIISYSSSNISKELTSRYTCNTTEHVLLDSHTKCDSTASLLHINLTPNILERAFTLPVVTDVCTKIASITSPIQPCVKMTIDTGSYVADGVKSIIHSSAPSIPGSATAAHLTQVVFGRATTALVQLDTLACSGFDYLVTWINNRENTVNQFTKNDENGTNEDRTYK